jgi:SAM-dependent methyltransferase
MSGCYGRRGVAEREFWDRVYARLGASFQSPFTAPLHEKILAIIPSNVETILDAGCGGGALMAALAREGKYDVRGIDTSPVAVKTARDEFEMDARLGTVLDMKDFQDDSFDLVICSEVIEHLKQGEIPKCVSELTRVARRYVITSNPFRECLSYHSVVCDRCASRFHAAGHINSVDETFLRRHLGPHVRSLTFYYAGRREWRSALYADGMRLAGYNVIELPGLECRICDHPVRYKPWSFFARMVGFQYRQLQRALRALGLWTSANIIALGEMR